MTNTIELISKDGQTFVVDADAIFMSQLIKDMVEDNEDEVPRIPVPNVESKVLAKVIEYCEYHHDKPIEEIEKPLKGNIDDLICDWDKKFLNVEQQELIEIIMASNYLNIKSLLDLSCAKIASMIKGKNPEQIREMFGIENDFSPEEEEKIREENKWCEA
jgi:S-phase kinase-associated protein 1